MKITLLAIAICSSILLPSAFANDNVIQTNDAKIYIEGFNVVNTKTNSNTNDVATQSVTGNSIGEVGSLSVVDGERPKNIVAYVQSNSNKNYLITDSILVLCTPNTTCIPSNYTAEQIPSTDLYKLTVSDYTQWDNTIKELSSSPNVISVTPNYEYGLTKSLK
jgi:hypothetical protein